MTIKKNDKVVWEMTNEDKSAPFNYTAMFTGTVTDVKENTARLVNVRLHTFECAEGFVGTLKTEDVTYIDTAKLKVYNEPKGLI